MKHSSRNVEVAACINCNVIASIIRAFHSYNAKEIAIRIIFSYNCFGKGWFESRHINITGSIQSEPTREIEAISIPVVIGSIPKNSSARSEFGKPEMCGSPAPRSKIFRSSTRNYNITTRINSKFIALSSTANETERTRDEGGTRPYSHTVTGIKLLNPNLAIQRPC